MAEELESESSGERPEATDGRASVGREGVSLLGDVAVILLLLAAGLGALIGAGMLLWGLVFGGDRAAPARGEAGLVVELEALGRRALEVVEADGSPGSLLVSTEAWRAVAENPRVFDLTVSYLPRDGAPLILEQRPSFEPGARFYVAKGRGAPGRAVGDWGRGEARRPALRLLVACPGSQGEVTVVCVARGEP
jgi:hypothetical protein